MHQCRLCLDISEIFCLGCLTNLMGAETLQAHLRSCGPSMVLMGQCLECHVNEACQSLCFMTVQMQPGDQFYPGSIKDANQRILSSFLVG